MRGRLTFSYKELKQEAGCQHAAKVKDERNRMHFNCQGKLNRCLTFSQCRLCYRITVCSLNMTFKALCMMTEGAEYALDAKHGSRFLSLYQLANYLRQKL